MSASNYAKCLALTLGYEGGKDDHPKDPGGRTAYGIIQRVYDAWRQKNGLPTKDVWTISEAEKLAIYRENYWDPLRGDELPPGLDMVTFDGGVNSGISRGAKWLQGALGITADGKVGPATIAAAEACKDRAAVVRKACASRLSFVRSLKTFATFGKGWSRRIADVEAKASAMTFDTAAAAKANAEAQARKANAGSKAKATIATLTGGSGASASLDPSTVDTSAAFGAAAPWIAVAIVAALVAVAVVYAVKARNDKHRADAYAASAAELNAQVEGV